MNEQKVKDLVEAIRAVDRELSALPIPDFVAMRRDLWQAVFDKMIEVEDGLKDQT